MSVGGFVLMAVSLFIGSHILAFFGLTITAIQIGGGLVVMAAGWRLLMQGDDTRAREQPAAAPDEETMMRRAFFPLTMPLTVGPGTISVAITLGTQAAGTEHIFWKAAGGVLAALAVAGTNYSATALPPACCAAWAKQRHRLHASLRFHPAVPRCADHDQRHRQFALHRRPLRPA